MQGNLHDPHLHLFLDDEELQDYPEFVRKVQRPERVQVDPVLRPERPWEGRTVQIKGGVHYDEEEDLFRMWYWTWGCTIEEMNAGAPTFLCYATSVDGVEWERPELGLVEYEGSTANNITLATTGDPWGVMRDPQEQNLERRYKLGLYYQPPGSPGANDPVVRKTHFESIADRHGMYAAYSPDGIRWTFQNRLLVPRAGDAGCLVHDPIEGRYIASSRRLNCLVDHFVLEWKQYRRVIALSTSEDFVEWTPLRTVLRPDEYDEPGVQLYQMVPFVYGNQYMGIVWVAHPTELSGMELAAARDLEHWRRVGERGGGEFFSVGAPGSWDGGWAACGLTPPALKDDQLHIWYSGKPQGHGTKGNFSSAIGMLRLRRDGFVALRCGIRGGEVMTEPIEVTGPGLAINAICLFGELQVRVIDDYSVPEGYDFAECNGLERGDEISQTITWGDEKRDLSPFVGKRVRLHLRADNATSFFSYRFTGEP